MSQIENEAYSDYFQKKNKISLVMWVLINNNLVTRNLYLAFITFDFIINFILILCLYSQVNSVPILSNSLIMILDYDNPLILSIIAISQSCLLIIALAFMAVLVLKTYSWQIYGEKKIAFQILSLILVLFRTPLFTLSCLFIINNLSTFDQISNSYIKYISIVCSILSTIFLGVFTYVGSFLFNLAIPNALIPWSETSHQPYMISAMIRVLLVFAFKFRSSIVALYLLAALIVGLAIYRLY